MPHNDPPNLLSISRSDERFTSIAGFSVFGASCTNLSLSGKTLISEQKQPADSIYFGSTVAPWPNRLKDGRFSLEGKDYRFAKLDAENNANHGLLEQVALEVRSHREDKLVLGHRFGSQEYPFDVDLEVSFEIAEGFSVAATATNFGSSAAPFALGFHPYFRLVAPGQLTANVSQHLKTDERKIPISREAVDGLEIKFPSKQSYDDCYFDPNWRAEFHTAEFAFEMTQQNLPYLMIYTPEDSPFADGSNSVAIEPLSAPANAFQDDLEGQLIQPGETREYGFQIRMLS
jgi:aldose 1-epimerase